MTATRRITIVLTLVVIGLGCGYIIEKFRATQIRLQLQFQENALFLSVQPWFNAHNCLYRVFVAADPVELQQDKRLPLLHIVGRNGESKVALRDTPKLRQTQAENFSAYFEAVANCGGAAEQNISSGIVPFAPPTAIDATLSSKEDWIAALKATPPSMQLKVVNAYPQLSFQQPTDIQSAPGSTGRLFVVEKGGRIFSIDNNGPNPEKSLFLDIHERVAIQVEQGLLGLAFHPQFAENSNFFVYYSTSTSNRLSRFTVSGSDQADPQSEKVLLEVPHHSYFHQGGQIRFGPDGYLYIGIGDGGPHDDLHGHGQNRSTLRAAILRINVAESSDASPYTIPSSNPFYGNSQGWREEIFAFGLRNPYRFSFDPRDGALWVGDVGRANYEEINVVHSGKNYGWNSLEGDLCFQPRRFCRRKGMQEPALLYSRNVGGAIIGGFIYQGSALSGLKGYYIFADFKAGRLFAVDTSIQPYTALLIPNEQPLFISTFGLDEKGELLFADFTKGTIYKFEPTLPPQSQ